MLLKVRRLDTWQSHLYPPYPDRHATYIFICIFALTWGLPKEPCVYRLKGRLAFLPAGEPEPLKRKQEQNSLLTGRWLVRAVVLLMCCESGLAEAKGCVYSEIVPDFLNGVGPVTCLLLLKCPVPCKARGSSKHRPLCYFYSSLLIHTLSLRRIYCSFFLAFCFLPHPSQQQALSCQEERKQSLLIHFFETTPQVC